MQIVLVVVMGIDRFVIAGVALDENVQRVCVERFINGHRPIAKDSDMGRDRVGNYA